MKPCSEAKEAENSGRHVGSCADAEDLGKGAAKGMRTFAVLMQNQLETGDVLYLGREEEGSGTNCSCVFDNLGERGQEKQVRVGVALPCFDWVGLRCLHGNQVG